MMNDDLSNYTVLVVDDAPDSLSLISDTLEQVGINTLVALDGKQALAIAKNIRPDIILLDAIMPNMDGFETCTRLKLIDSLNSVPVMFMTGLDDTENIVKGLSVGGVDYLTKPVNPNELIARMKVHINNAALAENAYHALDRLGQAAIMVDENASVLWATPETHALISRVNWEQNKTTIAHWLSQSPDSNNRLPLPAGADETAEIRFIERREPQSLLLRIIVDSDQARLETLRTELKVTKREAEVLFWLANGKSNKDIAEILDMSVRTVNKHLEQMFPKLGVENRTAAAGMAIRLLN